MADYLTVFTINARFKAFLSIKNTKNLLSCVSMVNERDKNSDKLQKAIALKYDMEHEQAPRVVAKGEGSMAEQIIKIAQEHGIEIKEDADLTEVLTAIEIDDFIPLEAYATVAEILRYIYKKDGKMK